MTMVLDSIQFQQLVREVSQALSSNSEGVGEVPVVDTLSGISSLPALRLLNGLESVVEAPLSLLSKVAEDGAEQANEATRQAVIAAVRADGSADLADMSRLHTEASTVRAVAATQESIHQALAAKETCMSTEDTRLAALATLAALQEKIDAASLVISSTAAGMDELAAFQKKADDAFVIIARGAEDARNASDALFTLRTLVSGAINGCLSAINGSMLATDEARLYADLALKSASLADARGAEAIRSASGADSAASHAGEQALRAEVAAEAANIAADNANDTANHPTIVGEDNYVYKWNKGTRSYDKTDVYVRGEGFKVSRVFVSVDEMEAYAGAGLEEGDFVLINTGSVEDADTAKLYTYNPDATPKWQFLVDMSGAIGFTGKTPQFSIGTITSVGSGTPASAALTADGVDTGGNPKYKLNIAIPEGAPLRYEDLSPGQISELQRPAIDAIAILNQTNAAVQTAEGSRVENETARKSAETARATAERGRVAAEELRCRAETERSEAVAVVVTRALDASKSAEGAASDCRAALEGLEQGGGTVDTGAVVEALTAVVDTYKADLDTQVGDMAGVMDAINEDTQVSAACALLDEINGEVV